MLLLLLLEFQPCVIVRYLVCHEFHIAGDIFTQHIELSRVEDIRMLIIE